MTECELYLDYKRELCALTGEQGLVDGLLQPKEDYIADVEFFKDNKSFDWVRIADEKYNEIGFVIIQRERTGGAINDYEIIETYIVPEHRRKGVMTNYVRQYATMNPGIYKVNIMPENVVAQKFWLNVPDGKKICKMSEENHLGERRYLIPSKDRFGNDCLTMQFISGDFE